MGQSYNDASVISEEFKGRQATIREHSPTAAYVHCVVQTLNLLISKSSQAAEICDCCNDATERVNFFYVSPQ